MPPRMRVSQANAEKLWITYFFQRLSDGAVKIGYALNAGERLNQVRREHGELKVLHSTFGGRDMEFHIHAFYSERRIGGEWFLLTVEQINDLPNEPWGPIETFPMPTPEEMGQSMRETIGWKERLSETGTTWRRD